MRQRNIQVVGFRLGGLQCVAAAATGKRIWGITFFKNLNMSTNGPRCHEYVLKSNAEVGACLLDDLEKCSVKLGEDLVAVFQLKANVVGLHPGDVLNTQQPAHE